MTPLFKKLNLADARSITVLNAPASFEAELQALERVEIARQIQRHFYKSGQICFSPLLSKYPGTAPLLNVNFGPKNEFIEVPLSFERPKTSINLTNQVN
jgi:hypothetical protein